MEKLYRRNNNGTPSYWRARLDEDMIVTEFGIVGGKPIVGSFKVTQKDGVKELNSRYEDKRKNGYLSLDEIRDDSVELKGCSPVEGDALFNYLNAYLPTNLVNTSTGAILPMRAKTYNGNIWKKVGCCSAQWKINGLRCLISVYKTQDIFRPYRLKFQSREGIWWHSLDDLEDYMLQYIGKDILERMYSENITLDGELYIPGYSVNTINHIVKDPNCPENKLLQYWCYDIAIDDMSTDDRNMTRIELCVNFHSPNIKTYDDHIHVKHRMIYVPNEYCFSDNQAVEKRNKYIGLGFEGLILRNLDSTYQFGRRRANYMEKFKSTTDGLFEIVAIDKEKKRNLPLITCRNDVNDATFECRLNGSFDYQVDVLNNKDKYIGKKLYITFGERSGIEKVPFHIKEVKLAETWT